MNIHTNMQLNVGEMHSSVGRLKCKSAKYCDGLQNCSLGENYTKKLTNVLVYIRKLQ